MKKLMLLALAAISALLVVPTFASATPAHVQAHGGGNPGKFTVHGGASTLSRTGGLTTTGTTLSGSGSFESTTTGTVNLLFHGVTDSLGRKCTTVGQPEGTVSASGLPFHIIMIAANTPGILITPPAGKPFADYVCGSGIFATTITVKGNGIIGTITAPACGGSSTTATLRFESSSHGNQKHTTWTGNTYDLDSTLNSASTETSAMDAHATITFEGTRTLICT